VIVAYQNQVAIEETLDASLARLFGGVLPPPPAPRGRDRGPFSGRLSVKQIVAKGKEYNFWSK
jgi:hypothetical protein